MKYMTKMSIEFFRSHTSSKKHFANGNSFE